MWWHPISLIDSIFLLFTFFSHHSGLQSKSCYWESQYDCCNSESSQLNSSHGKRTGNGSKGIFFHLNQLLFQNSFNGNFTQFLFVFHWPSLCARRMGNVVFYCSSIQYRGGKKEMLGRYFSQLGTWVFEVIQLCTFKSSTFRRIISFQNRFKRIITSWGIKFSSQRKRLCNLGLHHPRDSRP